MRKFGNRGALQGPNRGRFRHAMTLLDAATCPYGASSSKDVFKTLGNVFAQIEQISPNKQYENAAVFGPERTPTHRITLAHHISDYDQEVFLGLPQPGGIRLFEVLQLSNPDVANRWTVCLCRQERLIEYEEC